MSSSSVKLILISSAASLEEMELVLGHGGDGGHSLGSTRPNGLVNKQSMWYWTPSSEADLLEDQLDELLDWLSARVAALNALDSDIFCKVSCNISAVGEQDGLAINPRRARKLADMGVMLLINIVSN